VQTAPKTRFPLFFFYETARQTVSIFLRAPTKDHWQG
jgi:hypothetical protein